MGAFVIDANLLMALVATLVEIVRTAKFDKESRTMHLKALSDFLGSVAECLIMMKTDLAQNKVPTFAGNKLNQVIAHYEDIIAKAPLDKQLRISLLETKAKIERCLTDGEALDDIIRGHILYAPKNDREAVLLEMERTAAKIQGIVAALPVSS